MQLENSRPTDAKIIACGWALNRYQHLKVDPLLASDYTDRPASNLFRKIATITISSSREHFNAVSERLLFAECSLIYEVVANSCRKSSFKCTQRAHVFDEVTC